MGGSDLMRGRVVAEEEDVAVQPAATVEGLADETEGIVGALKS